MKTCHENSHVSTPTRLQNPIKSHFQSSFSSFLVSRRDSNASLALPELEDRLPASRTRLERASLNDLERRKRSIGAVHRLRNRHIWKIVFRSKRVRLNVLNVKHAVVEDQSACRRY